MEPERFPKKPIDWAIGDFAHAAAAACVFELKCRLVADKAELGDRTLSCGLDALVKQLIDEHGERLTEEETALLKSCAVVRNKMLHLELARTVGKLVSVGEVLERGGIHMVDVKTGDVRQVSETKTLTGRVYGWLFESSESGAFEVAERRFFDACDALESKILAKLNDDEMRRAGNEP